MMEVMSEGPASPRRVGEAGTRRRADVAQLAERVLGKDEVTSSILVIGSINEFGTVSVGASNGERKIRSFETTRQRRDHRAHRSWQDDADGGADEGGGRQGVGEVRPV